MKLRPISLILTLLLTPLPAFAQATPQEPPPFQKHFPAEEFKARWAKAFEQIGKSIAIVQGAPSVRGYNLPRQTNEFYYLTGVETPHSYVILDGYHQKVIICLPPRNAALESAEGRVISADDAAFIKRATGADEVWFSRDPGTGNPALPIMNPDNLKKLFDAAPVGGAGGAAIIYTPQQPAEGSEESRDTLRAANMAVSRDPWDQRPTREQNFANLLKQNILTAEIKDLSPILDNLRNIKSPREIALIRRASQIAGLAIMEAMRSTKPGVKEFELEAAARYNYIINGSRLQGYRAIIAGGTANINNMHYFRNSESLRDGDLVIMDYAPDYGLYTSDVTRMWPVNGKFAPWQRELLGFVLEYRNCIISRIKPGIAARTIQFEARAAMEPVFARWKFSKPEYEEACRTLVNMGGGVFSHTVGMAVHDVARYQLSREETTQGLPPPPLKPGQVFSIDPQLRVRSENLYIRYEDVVVVTETGVENFTDFLPSKLEDIEKLTGTGGIVQKYPPISEEQVKAMSK